MPVFYTDIDITTTVAIEAATEEEARAKAEKLKETEVDFISHELKKYAPRGTSPHFIGMVYKIDHNYEDWGPARSKG